MIKYESFTIGALFRLQGLRAAGHCTCCFSRRLCCWRLARPWPLELQQLIAIHDVAADEIDTLHWWPFERFGPRSVLELHAC